MNSTFTYYDFAEDDYKTVKRLQQYMQDNNDATPTNTMCSLAQKAIEKYFKHLIETEIDDTKLSSADLVNKNRVMHTHTLRDLIAFTQQHIPNFTIDSRIRYADGYYFDTNYPGQNAFFVSDTDINDCIGAMEIMKLSVDQYLGLS